MRSKYGNKKTEVDGILFDSKKEANRYQQLKLMERARAIIGLELQPAFSLVVNEMKVCTYKADFRYGLKIVKGSDATITVVEDVKGIKTPIYNLKKKLMKALYGIEITEI